MDALAQQQLKLKRCLLFATVLFSEKQKKFEFVCHTSGISKLYEIIALFACNMAEQSRIEDSMLFNHNFQKNQQHPALLREQDPKHGYVRAERPPTNFEHFHLSTNSVLVASGGSACFLVALFGRGLLNTQPQHRGRQKNSCGSKVYKFATDVVGVLILTRLCFPSGDNGKFWRDPFVSHGTSFFFFAPFPPIER